MRSVAGLRVLVDALVAALLPVQCAGCRAWDEVLCSACLSLARVQPCRDVIEGARGQIPVFVVGDYSFALRRIVLSAKHSLRTDVSVFLDEAGAALGARVARELGVVGSAGERGQECGAVVDVWVVPAPSSLSRRVRGRAVALPLARAVARGLAARARAGVRVFVVDAVRLRVGAGSQSGRAGAQRVAGRVGAMRVRARPGEGVRVVAVDDVVTTGATIREMERVLGGLDGVAALCRAGLSHDSDHPHGV